MRACLRIHLYVGMSICLHMCVWLTVGGHARRGVASVNLLKLSLAPSPRKTATNRALFVIYLIAALLFLCLVLRDLFIQLKLLLG